MSSAVAAPPGTAIATRVPPNQSLYIQNLPEKLQKQDLKRNLYMLLSTFGPVLDIIAMRGAKMRGQAHVLFKDVHSATQAMRQCQGFEFFGREMKISYSKTRSNTLAKLTGTFVDPQSTESAKLAAGGLAQPPASFPAPPGSGLPAPPSGLPPPPGMPAKPNGGLQAPPGLKTGADGAPSPAGTKRPRDESDDEDGDGEAPMEEDSDEGGEMEMSDDDD